MNTDHSQPTHPVAATCFNDCLIERQHPSDCRANAIQQVASMQRSGIEEAPHQSKTKVIIYLTGQD